MNTEESKLPEQLDLFQDIWPGASSAGLQHSQPSIPVETASVKAPVLPSSSLEAALPDVSRNTPKALADALHHELEMATGKVIILAITNNTSNMMSVVLDAGGVIAKVRLHHMFLDAPQEVRAALAYWIKHPKSRKYADRFRNFIVSRDHQIRKTAAAPARIRTCGTVYDLRSFYDELNAAYFGSTVDAAITWGREVTGPMRSIRFGSYYEATHLIRIHPRLDQSFVPEYVVRYIVYHEMLHAHLGISRSDGGRRQVHPKKFKDTEKTYPDYDRAVSWIEDPANLNKLLRSRRKARKA